MNSSNGKKLIAWGRGSLLVNYLKAHPKDHGLSYIVDSFQKEKGEYLGLPYLPLSTLETENPELVTLVVFPVNNASRRAVRLIINSLGRTYGTGYIDAADLFRKDFEKKAFDFFDRPIKSENYDLARAHDNNSYVPVETTVCGSWLLLECLDDIAAGVPGPVVEAGAYRGGNAVLMLEALAMKKDPRTYFILDSFEGFPEMHEYDQKSAQKIYNQEYNLLEIHDRFSMFTNSKVIRGFIPETFSQLPKDTKYSMVFFDCDLYAPAVATLDYFWDRLNPGGFFIMHDYMHATFEGVTRAVDEFCAQKKIKPHVFFEATMACLRKA